MHNDFDRRGCNHFCFQLATPNTTTATSLSVPARPPSDDFPMGLNGETVAGRKGLDDGVIK